MLNRSLLLVQYTSRGYILVFKIHRTARPASSLSAQTSGGCLPFLQSHYDYSKGVYTEGTRHKVHTYVENRAVSGVFQNIDPLPPPSPQRVCPPPAPKAYTLAGRWGVNILEDARHWIGILQYNPSTERGNIGVTRVAGKVNKECRVPPRPLDCHRRPLLWAGGWGNVVVSIRVRQ